MNVGDLVKWKRHSYWGVGLVLRHNASLADVVWNQPSIYKDTPEIAPAPDGEWLWKSDLEVISESR